MLFLPFVTLTPSKTSLFTFSRDGQRSTLMKVERSSFLECAQVLRAGTGNGHCLINETAEDVLYLEIGDRTAGDEGSYPDDDLKAMLVEGKWKFVHKDGTPYL